MGLELELNGKKKRNSFKSLRPYKNIMSESESNIGNEVTPKQQAVLGCLPNSRKKYC